MTETNQPYRVGTRQTLIYGGISVGVFALLSLPSVITAMVFVRLIRGKMKRVETLAVAASCVVCVFVNPAYFLTQPSFWLWELVGPPDAGWPPVLAIAVQAAFLASIWMLLSQTRMWTKVTDRSTAAAKAMKNPFHTESLVPDERTKARARVVPMPSGDSVTSRSRSTPAELLPGHRDISFSVDSKLVPVKINERELGMHAVILGSTGSGKTETIKSLAGALADLDYPVLLLDLKEDTQTGGLRDFAKTYARSHNTDFQELSLSDPNPDFWFNPFLGMGPDEAREVVLSLSEFDDEHWQSINKKLLGQLINMLYDAHEADPTVVPYPTIFELGRVLSKSSLNDATKKMRGLIKTRQGAAYDEERYSAMSSPTAEEQKTASGFGAKLTQMYATVAGRTMLRPDTEGHRQMLDVTRPGITYVGLSMLAQRDLATVISSAVLQRMAVYAAARASGRESAAQQRAVIIDEANAINREIVKNLLARARSAKVMMVLCTQSPEDWIDARGDDWSTMANNVNVAMIMSQGSSHSAELCAEFIGQKKQMMLMQSAERGEWSDRQSMRETTDFIVQPHDLRSMSIGEMILRVGKPAERVVWATVKVRDPTTHPTSKHLPRD